MATCSKLNRTCGSLPCGVPQNRCQLPQNQKRMERLIKVNITVLCNPITSAVLYELEANGRSCPQSRVWYHTRTEKPGGMDQCGAPQESTHYRRQKGWTSCLPFRVTIMSSQHLNPGPHYFLLICYNSLQILPISLLASLQCTSYSSKIVFLQWTRILVPHSRVQKCHI